MKLRILSLLAVLLPLLCQAADGESTYYSVRPDLRKCISPLCGGVFVQRINRIGTPCGDGRWRNECYVADVDLSALNLTEEQAGVARSLIQSGHVLLRGSVRVQQFGDVGALGQFVATEVWEAATEAPPAGTFYRAANLGLLCITSPCASFRETRLNTLIQRPLAGVELSRSGASDGKQQAAQTQLRAQGGVLVSGTHKRVRGPGGTALALVANQFYLPLGAGLPIGGEPKRCYVGGCSGQLCGDDPGKLISTCIYTPAYACYRTAACEVQADGNCGWTPSDELKACLDKAYSHPIPNSVIPPAPDRHQ